MTRITVQSLHYYPIKSLAGHSVAQWEAQPRGFKYDRRWMFVDADHNFITQRTVPVMAHWQAAVSGEDLVITDRRDPTRTFRVPQAMREQGERIDVTLFDHQLNALHVDFPEAEGCAGAMGLPAGAKLVYMDEALQRPINPDYAQPGELVSLADGYPYLITNSASAEDFSARMGEEVTMRRFRPNIVVQTDTAWLEDQWQRLTIGGQPFRIPKPCSRCRMITVDPDTAEMRMEYFAQLAAFRKVGKKILFGVNAIWEGQESATISVGDEVIVD